MPVLYNRKSIYFAPAKRVLPTKFFMGWSWMSNAVRVYLEAGAFYEVESYDRITRNRIRKALESCPAPKTFIEFEKQSLAKRAVEIMNKYQSNMFA